MSQCHERFYKALKVTLVIENVTIDEIAAIQDFILNLRKEKGDASVHN